MPTEPIFYLGLTVGFLFFPLGLALGFNCGVDALRRHNKLTEASSRFLIREIK